MKNNQLALMLVFVLLLSALFSVWLTFRYNGSLKKLQQLSPQVAYVNSERAMLQGLLAETVEYNRKSSNGAMTQILQSLQQPASRTVQPSATKK
jgi:ABC-type transport system involved in cytochrome c biogenesis permease component